MCIRDRYCTGWSTLFILYLSLRSSKIVSYSFEYTCLFVWDANGEIDVVKNFKSGVGTNVESMDSIELYMYPGNRKGFDMLART